MRFVDHCRVQVVAGDGGNGVVAFRREKFIPFGGPSGGDGGGGGDVIIEAAEGLSSLQDVVYQRKISAERGEHGQGSDKYGRAGKDRVIRVPAGTQVFDEDTGDLVIDMVEHGQQFVAAKGGRGGKGNIHFATPFDRAPRRAEKGEVGESRNLRFELKVMADVGLVGFPNVGKSTFVSTVSAARPKIADYPFTTLIPMLGVVDVFGGPQQGGSRFVIADIPGLIPGASEGIGLGTEFLKHVERTRVLLHLVTLDAGEGREPIADYKALRKELARFSPELATRPEVVVLSKSDLPDVREAYDKLAQRFAKLGKKLQLISAATRDGIAPLVEELWRRVRGLDVAEEVALAAEKRKADSLAAKTEAAAKKTSAAKPAPKKSSPKPTAKKPKPTAKKPKPTAKKPKPAAKKPKPAAKKPKPTAKKPKPKAPSTKSVRRGQSPRKSAKRSEVKVKPRPRGRR